MKKYIFLAVILSIVLFFTKDLLAQKKDTLAKKEFGAEISGGSRANLKGIDFSGSLFFSRNRMQYALQYNYYGYNYANLDNVNLHEYLENAHMIAILTGYKIPIQKFSVIPMAGISIGRGRFASTDSYDNGYTYGMIGDNTAYNKRDFIGLVFNCALRYRMTDNISAGLTFNTFLFSNNNLLHPDPYYGLQLSAGYKIKEWENYHRLDTTKNKGHWEINLAGGVDYGKVAIKENGSMIKKYKSDNTILANYTKLSFSRIFHSGAALRLTFQKNRITYEQIYNPDGPLSKSKTWYDLLAFNINGGYNHNFKRISLYSYLGIGIGYLSKKAKLRISLSGISWDPDYYDFSSNSGPRNTRFTIPVSFSLGMDYRLNRLFSLSLNSGVDYNLTPFVLAHDGYSEYDYIAHYIRQYSIYGCVGITFKIQKSPKK